MSGGSMATKSENSEIAVLQDQMETVKGTLTEVRTDVKSIITTLSGSDGKYATKKELQDAKDELNKSKRNQLFTAVLVTAIITGLVAFFFAHLSTANNPTTSSTTTVNTPGGSTSTTSTKDGTPSSSATATSHSDTATPSDSQTSNGGVTLTVPKVSQ